METLNKKTDKIHIIYYDKILVWFDIRMKKGMLPWFRPVEIMIEIKITKGISPDILNSILELYCTLMYIEKRMTCAG